MQNSLVFKTTLSLLILCTSLIFASYVVKHTDKLHNFLNEVIGNSIALAQNHEECSDHIGEATLNEVNDSGTAAYEDGFIEVYLADIDPDEVEEWDVVVCQGHPNTDCHPYPLDNGDTFAPYIVIEDTEEMVSIHHQEHQASSISLRDDQGAFVDYLSISGYGGQENYDERNPDQCNFEFDVEVNSAKNRDDGVQRINPDGTGNWEPYKDSQESATPGDPNYIKDEVEEGDFNVVEDKEDYDYPNDLDTKALFTKVAGKNFDVKVIRANYYAEYLFSFPMEMDLELVKTDPDKDCSNLKQLADFEQQATFNWLQMSTTVEDLSYDNAIVSARIRVTHDLSDDYGCSQDTFTIRPHHVTIHATNENWETPGTERTLNSTLGGTCVKANGSDTCHKAGYPFTLQGSAYNYLDDKISKGYTTIASINQALKAPEGGVNESLNPDFVYFDGFSFGPNNATYPEVGLIDLSLNDNGNFAAQSEDKMKGQCVSNSSINTPNDEGKYGCQTTTKQPKSVGRFVPDRFQLTSNTSFFEPFCNGFTYLDQPFYYFTAPKVTLNALNANNNTTQNYGNNFWRFEVKDDYLVGRTYQNRANVDAFLNATKLDNATVTGQSDFNGQWAFNLHDYDNSTTSGDEFRYQKNGTEDPFDAAVDLILDKADLTDQDGVCYEVNGNCASYTIDNITGTELRYGRTIVENAYGSDLRPLTNIGVRTEYYGGSSFKTNTNDTCTVYNATEIDWSSATYSEQGNLTAGDLGSSGDGTFQDGEGSFSIHKDGDPDDGPGKTGYVDYRFPVPAWLKFDWNDNGTRSNPPARATFGIYKGNEHIIYQQETTWK